MFFFVFFLVLLKCCSYYYLRNIRHWYNQGVMLLVLVIYTSLPRSVVTETSYIATVGQFVVQWSISPFSFLRTEVRV